MNVKLFDKRYVYLEWSDKLEGKDCIIAQTYQDLKDFVLLYNKSQQIAKDAAVFMCCLNFANNWGSKIAILLPYIHSLVYKEKYEQYES